MRQLTRRQRFAALALIVTALCFLTLDLGGGALGSAHSGVRGTLGSLYRGTDSVLGPVRRFVQGVPSAGTNQARVDRLRHENAVLRGQLAAAAADRTTEDELARLRLAADSTGYSVVPARVIALGPGQGFDWTVTLDTGTSDGVHDGQTVTDGAGLVGRVLHADRSSSVVLLSADPGSGVGARDLRTGQIGVATGRGASGFTLVPLDPRAALQIGDRLVTGPSGATSFVANLSIGVITSVRTSADGTTSADVAPATSATTLDLVGVLVTGSVSGGRVALAPSTTQTTGGR